MVMLDEEGSRVRHQTFSPFGRVHAELGGSGLRTFYAGHRRDEGSGMFYMQARWYDPSSGTMLSVDPLVPAVDDPLSSNPYTYSRNNPTNLTDPDGQCFRVGITCGVNETLLGTVKEYTALLKNGDKITITVTEILGLGKLATLDGAALDGAADADAADARLQNDPSSSAQDQSNTGATAGNDLASESDSAQQKGDALLKNPTDKQVIGTGTARAAAEVRFQKEMRGRNVEAGSLIKGESGNLRVTETSQNAAAGRESGSGFAGSQTKIRNATAIAISLPIHSRVNSSLG